MKKCNAAIEVHRLEVSDFLMSLIKDMVGLLFHFERLLGVPITGKTLTAVFEIVNYIKTFLSRTFIIFAY